MHEIAQRSLFIGLVASALLFAQFGAIVQGTVNDSSGAVIPTATVTITNNETHRKQTTTTSADGFYRFSAKNSKRFLPSTSQEACSFTKMRWLQNTTHGS